jgi:hypothetical protein
VCNTKNTIARSNEVNIIVPWKLGLCDFDSGDAEVNIIVDWVRLEEVFIIVSYAVEVVCGWTTKVLLGEFGIGD